MRSTKDASGLVAKRKRTGIKYLRNIYCLSKYSHVMTVDQSRNGNDISRQIGGDIFVVRRMEKTIK